jgi:hypothetical protein
MDGSATGTNYWYQLLVPTGSICLLPVRTRVRTRLLYHNGSGRTSLANPRPTHDHRQQQQQAPAAGRPPRASFLRVQPPRWRRGKVSHQVSSAAPRSVASWWSCVPFHQSLYSPSLSLVALHPPSTWLVVADPVGPNGMAACFSVARRLLECRKAGIL